MNKNNISKEFIFNLFLKFHPQVVSELIGYKVEELKLEKNYFGRKIDAYTENDYVKIFIESQLTKSDNHHLKQIKFLIDNAEKDKLTYIIWCAQSFNENMINEIVNKIARDKKNIEFIAVKINQDMIESLELLSQINEFKIIDNLHKLCSKNRLEIVAKYYRKFSKINSNNDENLNRKHSDEKQIIMERILEEIREQLYYFPTVYREKKLIGNVLILGAGRNDIVYAAGVNRRNEIFVELKFNNSTRSIFNDLYGKKQEIDDYFDYMIDWNKGLFKIYSSEPYKGNVDRVIKRQIRILDKLVKYFANIQIISDYSIES